MRTIILFILAFASSMACFSQGGFISKIYTAGAAHHWTMDIFELSGGNYLGLGISVTETGTANQYKLCVCGLDQAGNAQWVKTYGGDTLQHLASPTTARTSFRRGNAVYYAGGVRSINSKHDYGTLIKFDLQGNIVWQKFYRDSSRSLMPQKASAAVDGGILIGGYLQDFTIHTEPCLLLKVDYSGKEQWRSELSKSEPDAGDVKALIQDDSTKKILLLGKQTVGTKQSFGVYDNIIVTDSVGVELYRDNYFSFPGIYTDAVQTEDGKFVVLGYLNNHDFITKSSPFIYKFDISDPGNPIWKISMYDGFKMLNFFYCLTRLSDSTLLVAGNCDTLVDVDGLRYNHLSRYLKVNSRTGEVISERFYNYAENSTNHNTQACVSIQATADGGWISALRTVNAGNNPLFYVKYDSAGCDKPAAGCKLVSLPSYQQQNYFEIYPLPVSGELKVSLHGIFSGGSLTIADLSGRIVLAHEFDVTSQNLSVDVSALRSGLYVLQIYQNGQLCGTRKIFKD